ncbi:MAG: transposase [Pseudonocardiales bacterium]|nr:transposase [Pseudonocardiales bacterium]
MIQRRHGDFPTLERIEAPGSRTVLHMVKATGPLSRSWLRKRQRCFEGFDEKIVALYCRGMSIRDIEAHLRELNALSVGRDRSAG